MMMKWNDGDDDILESADWQLALGNIAVSMGYYLQQKI